MKNVLITGGPTNEAIDKVMTITNMSTGSLSCSLAGKALENGSRVTLILHESVKRSKKFFDCGLADNPNVKAVWIDSCQDMYDALEAESKTGIRYDTVIHASAVGDYRPEFTFKMEDMADEIAEKLQKANAGACGCDKADLSKFILDIMTNPDCKLRDDSKISSYEPHLTTKLTLTTKLISNLKRWFPDALLIGCKLLENVTKEHLFEIAVKLANKNNMDYIMANDLAELNKGGSTRYLCTKEGFTGIMLNAPGQPKLLDYAKENWL